MLQEYRISNEGKIITFDKVANAIELLQMHEPPEGYYVAFSGGKDSVVILDLVKQTGVKYDAHYHITTVDPPELVQFIRKEYPEVERHVPDKTMWQLVVYKQFPPLRQQRWCCEMLKEGGGKNRRIVTGVRWAESSKRSKRRTVENCMRDSSKTFINPIIDWEDEEVWKYIKTNKIAYCGLYDEGFTRLGCVMCPAASQSQRQHEAKRWPGIANAWKRAITKSYRAAIESGKVRTWATGEEMYDDWLAGMCNKGDPDQGVLFE